MKLKLSCFVKSVLLLSILAAGLLLNPKMCFAAQTESKPEGIKTLDKDTVYEYDLNGDGKTDKILYKVTENEEKFTTALELYINDKLCLSRQDYGYRYTIQVCDLDKSDNYLDLFMYETIESDCINFSYFLRYDTGKLSDSIKFDPHKLSKYFNTIRYSLGTVDGDGKFSVIIDTPIFSNAIGCYCCSVPYQIKDKVISKVPVKTYKLTRDCREYQYKAAKSFPVYEKAGSKKAVFRVKKGDKVTFDKLYVSESGKAYFRIISSKGKKGWIKSNQKNLFVECPMWG